MNKVNDKRKATAMFIVNLMKLNAIESSSTINIINVLLGRILNNMTSSEKTKEIEEIAENLFVLVKNSKSILETTKEWNTDILPNIQKLSNSSIKQDNPGISSRVVFKFMDML